MTKVRARGGGGVLQGLLMYNDLQTAHEWELTGVEFKWAKILSNAQRKQTMKPAG